MKADDAMVPPPATGSDRLRVAVGALTIFAGAFLLFLVQPTVAKMVLPWFGGSAAVWTVAMLFFQLLLLLGYLYAHAVQRLAPNRFLALHLSLLALSLLSLPLLPESRFKPTGAEDPTSRLLGLLTVTVGIPYFLLSTTGPLMQARLHSSGPRGNPSAGGPYRLYALSNLGSLLALLAYPTVVEPNLTTRMQGMLWSAGYVVFALLSTAALALTSRVAGHDGSGGAAPARQHLEATGRRQPPGRERRFPKERPEPSSLPGTGGTPVTWFLLAATAVTLLLGVTNRICQDVAAVPFLWILPLTLYLLSFILCFDARGWYRRTWFLALLPLAIAAMGYALIPWRLGEKSVIAILSGGLLICCMVCHGELHRSRPLPDRLTGFYLAISAGGAAGGLFVALLAPRLFTDYDELPLGLVFLGALVLACLRRDPESRFYRARGRRNGLIAAAALVAFALLVLYRMAAVGESSRVRGRNFYGCVRVFDRVAGALTIRGMHHGATTHGEQILSPGLGRLPTTYYGESSGVGMALTRVLSSEAPPRHVGVVGLGTGTLAAYGRPGDRFRFYEINPLVTAFAKTEFTYLADSRATVSVIPGDARLSLERESPQRFDLLVVDAFSGDSVPVHLLTLEAFALYQRHLVPGGILAVHVSNRFLDLAPVVALAARHRGLEAYVVRSPMNPRMNLTAAIWVLLAPDAGWFDDPSIRGLAEPISPPPSLRTWTDDYSNLLRSIR